MRRTYSTESGLTAGWARRRITPPAGVDLSGYVARAGPSVGVHDDIFADALVVDDGSTRVCIIGLDILAVDLAQDSVLRAAVAHAGGIPEKNILIGCSHTHGGPAVQNLRQCGTPDECYVRWMFEQVAAAVSEAGARMSSTRLAVTRAHSELGINRRSLRAGQGTAAPPDSGCVDPEVIALVIDAGPAGRALVFNYGCHGVVLGAENLLVTGDWITAAKSMLESQGAADLSLFLQGCCGDVNPQVRGSFADREVAGEMVAAPLMGAVADAVALDDPRIRVDWLAVELPLQPLPQREEIEQEISFRREELARMRAEGLPCASIHISEAMLGWAQDALSVVESGRVPGSVALPIQRLSFGDFSLIAIPGEVFSSIGLRIKAMRAGPTAVVGCANGNIGYIPDRSAFAEGGYEPSEAFKFYGIQMVGPESETVILNAAQTLLQGL